MNEFSDNPVFVFCDRLRQIRRKLNLTIEEVALRTGLNYTKIRRLEGSISRKNNKNVYKGCDGRAETLIILLNFYSQRMSIDMLLNYSIPVSEIPFDQAIVKNITKEKIIKIMGNMKELLQYME
jgi:transcriptional regulator with XRE-family HTH domain